jgi:hypothetical protein
LGIAARIVSEQYKQILVEGVVRASRYRPGDYGKQFLGAHVECADRRRWVIDYDEQSPFHGFADLRVVISGEPYVPKGQRIIGDHLRVSSMRLVEVAANAELIEVGPGHHLSGRFNRRKGDAGESMLGFVARSGDAFLVFNDPAGATVGRDVEVEAYCVKLSPAVRKPSGQYLWVICPYSMADLWEWRERRS